MIERAYIHVGGPAGTGKTTFVEAVLEACDEPILAARCVRNDSLRTSWETNPQRHPELRRYREAGASGVRRAPPDGVTSRLLWESTATDRTRHPAFARSASLRSLASPAQDAPRRVSRNDRPSVSDSTLTRIPA